MECKTDRFCFCCARYTKKALRNKFTQALRTKYVDKFGADILNKNLNTSSAGTIICQGCISNLYIKRNKFQRPAIWKEPNAAHKDCFVCINANVAPAKLLKKGHQMQGNLSVELPIPVPHKKREPKKADKVSNKKAGKKKANEKAEKMDVEDDEESAAEQGDAMNDD